MITDRIAVVHHREARVLGWLAFAAAVLPLGALLVFADHGSRWMASYIQSGVLLALPLAGAAALARRDLFARAGALRREGGDLVVEQGTRVRRFPLASITGGIIVPERDRVSVELRLADGRQIDARVDDVPAAEGLLRELKVDVASQRCRVQIADRLAAMVVAMAAPLGIVYF